MIDSDGTVEFQCGVCGMKTQEQREMYYIEKEESETHADMIVCSTCFQELVKWGEVTPYEGKGENS
jgi:hypothetical protein